MKSATRELEARLFEARLSEGFAQTSRMFRVLLLVQWAVAVVLAVAITPYTWAGTTRFVHVHIEIAAIFGGLLNTLPLALIQLMPAWWLTRHVVAASQMLWSALLIHLMGGRIETHFHIFVSLAFVAFYRDWRPIVTATLVVAADHVSRGLWFPESVYGVANPAWWRFLEHATWVCFEDIVLVYGCARSLAELRLTTDREAALSLLNAEFEVRVEARTRELTTANASLAREMQARLQAEAELRQAQKLEAVGRLASGVAHEINTPIQFVSDSLHFIREATSDLLAAVQRAPPPVPLAQGIATISRADEDKEGDNLRYLAEHLPRAIDVSLDGLGRVASIVRSMKEFAYPDSNERTPADLNRAIESTLTIARNEYKDVADVQTDFGEIPLVPCYRGEINQAILNLVVNAAHAVADAVEGTERRGRITVRTRREGDHVLVTVADTGRGIPAEIRDKIYDPFFTTKSVGRGTGQGLTMARSVIVGRHGGTLSFTTESGRGTTFSIGLPIGPSYEATAAEATPAVSAA